MTRPTVSPLAEQVYGNLWPLQPGDEDRAWALLLLIALCAQPFAEVDELVADTDDGPGWSILFDVDRTPGKWLDRPEAYIGARPPEGLTDDQRRNYIQNVAGPQRGIPAAIAAAAAGHLTGDQRVSYVERTNGAWQDTLVTYVSETPDPAAVAAAINDPTVKPIGRKIIYSVESGWSVAEFEAAYTTRTVSDFEAGFASVAAFESNL